MRKVKHKVIFYLFFFLLAAPPLSFPFMKNVVDSENHEKRKFAKAPELSLEKLWQFPGQFEAYFNDRLPYKNQLVMVNNIKNAYLGVGTTALDYLTGTTTIRGTDGWLFYNACSEDEQSFHDYLCDNLYDEASLAQIAEGYTKLQQMLKEEYGTELVVMYAANKEQVYPEFMPPKFLPKGSYSRVDQLVDYIRGATDVPLLYTKDALLKEKKNHQVFFKYDTHWNNLGGFVGQQVLNEYLHGEYVSLDDVPYSVIQENLSGDLADLLSMRYIYNDDVEYKIDGYKPEVKDELIEGEDTYEYRLNAKDKRTVMVIQDSFGYALMGMSKDFARVCVLKNTFIFKEYLEKVKPDILLIEIVQRNKTRQEEVCYRLMDLLLAEDAAK